MPSGKEGLARAKFREALARDARLRLEPAEFSAQSIRVFESASLAFPRSDYRPSFLYWSGRAHAKLGHGTPAESRLRLVFTDYANSYYGRLAERQLARTANAAASREDIRFVSHEQPPALDVKPTRWRSCATHSVPGEARAASTRRSRGCTTRKASCGAPSR